MPASCFCAETAVIRPVGSHRNESKHAVCTTDGMHHTVKKTFVHLRDFLSYSIVRCFISVAGTYI